MRDADGRFVVVIPAFNEARTIAHLVSRVKPLVGDILVVDDGSTDATASCLEGRGVTVLRNETNRGKGASLMRGFAEALKLQPDGVITMDADGQHAPEDLPKLIAAARDRPGSLILAARLDNRSAAPRLRRCANRFADFWISWAAGYKLVDTQSGYRVYPPILLRQLDLSHAAAHGFVFESEVLIEAARLGYYCEQVRIAATYLPSARKSHYLPVTDTWSIVRMVAGRLGRKWMYPRGLLRSLGMLPDPRNRGKQYFRE
jgi:glycosyltransferase involved in cell wall biosynthesis